VNENGNIVSKFMGYRRGKFIAVSVYMKKSSNKQLIDASQGSREARINQTPN
jgi:hypothetical protein